VQAAFEIGDCILQDGRAVWGAFETSAHSLSVLMPLNGLRVVLGNRFLMAGENVDAEPFAGMQMSVGTSAMVDTDEYEHGVKRNGCERIRCHAVHFSFVINRNHRDAGGKTAHRFAKV
jgi:hypothetical protein